MTTPPNHPTPLGERNTGVPGQVLGGHWFRREREQLAIGRAKMAAQLGTSPYNLRKMELMNWEIPREWISLLAELGFRVTAEPTAAEVPFQAEQSPTTLASAVVLTPIVEAASSPSDQRIPSFDGQLFRQERLRLRLTITGLAARLRSTTMEIRLLELSEQGDEKVVPQKWLPTLHKLGFWEERPLFGDWFRAERERLGIARDLLAARLGVKVWRVEYLERARPPAQVPPEWLVTVLALGFVDSRR